MNTHTFIHLGDLHLHPGARNEERRAAVDQIIDESRSVDVAAWLWPGDLFDSRSTIDDRNWLASRLQQMAGIAPVVICDGNHDLPGDLQVFSKLAAAHPIYVISAPSVLRLRLATGAFASLAVLPYPTRAGLLAAGTPSPSVTDAAREALEAIFRGFADQLEMARAKGDITAFIGHVNVAGSITSVGQPNVGKEIEIDSALLDMLGPIYKGLNHIHKGQRIGGAWYPGSVAPQNYGEIERKAYLRIEIADDAELMPMVSVRELRSAPMWHIEGDLTRDGFDYQATAGPGGGVQEFPVRTCDECGGAGSIEVADGCVPCTWCGGHDCEAGQGALVDWTGCDIRVRYRMKRSERSVLNEKLVADSFPGALRVQLDPIIDGDRDVRAPEVAAAVTLADKLSALLATGGQTVSDGLREKQVILERQPAEMVLTEVHQFIAKLEAVMAQQTSAPALEEALL